MAEILVVGEYRTTQRWSQFLDRAGHSVETLENALDMQERFGGAEIDILIVDINHADWGEALLIPQARATWPRCRIIAMASSYAFRSSAVYQMGLWTPDQLLIKPILPRILVATVTFLWAQIRSDQIREAMLEQPLAIDGPDHQPQVCESDPGQPPRLLN